MAEKVFMINKGIGKAVEFRGLKAQYIWYVAAAVIGTLILFAALHIAGVNAYLSVPVAFGVGGILVGRVFRMSKKYGQYGLMKRRARKEVPTALVSRSRKFFIHLFSDYASRTR